jgi:tripartite ATP-independent transporter DctP family solute receptor
MLVDAVTLGAVVDAAAISGVGFAFKNTQVAFTAMDGDLGAYVKAEIEAKGMFAFRRLFLNGMRQVTASPRAITGPDDLSNFKIRTPPAKMSVDLFKTLGASPTPMNFNEVYASLQTHIVDGQENPLAVIELAKLYEVQKYLSVTNHMWSGFWLVGNQDAWKALPPDMQAVILRNFDSFALAQRKDTDALNMDIIAKLATQGMSVNRPDPAAFRARLVPFYQYWKGEFGNTSWSLLEKYSGKLA